MSDPASPPRSETGVLIRPADVSEGPALSALALTAKAHWGYDEAFMATCHAELTVDRRSIETGIIRVAEGEGRRAGFYGLDAGRDGLCELDKLFVDPSWMGQGIGRALMDHAIAKAISLGARDIAVASDPHAEPFYRRMGFEPRGTIPSESIPGRHLPWLVLPLRARPAAETAARPPML